jgi:hypothetical protein
MSSDLQKHPLIQSLYAQAAEVAANDLMAIPLRDPGVQVFFDLIRFTVEPSSAEERLARLAQLRRLTYEIELAWEGVS